LLLAIVVGNGGHAGGMSPIAVGGVITTGLTAKLGLTGVSALIWYNNVFIHFLGAILAYFWFGGHKLWKNQSAAHKQMLASIPIAPFSRDQWITLAGLLSYICGVVFFKLDIGMGAFLIGTILTLLRVVNEEKAIKGMPWGAILMVTGVTVLISMMSKVGGIDLFAGLIATLSTASTVTIVTGTIAGVISAYASTTGVILTTFIPMAPALLQKVGAPPAELIPLISTIVACGFIVDMSPLSTSGAIYLANAHESQNKSRLFRDMLAWSLSMSVIGSIMCWLAFSVLRIP
jgi:di/tricarboxylate transporter